MAQKKKDQERYMAHLMLTILTVFNLDIERQHRSLRNRLTELKKAIDEYLEEPDG